MNSIKVIAKGRIRIISMDTIMSIDQKQMLQSKMYQFESRWCNSISKNILVYFFFSFNMILVIT